MPDYFPPGGGSDPTKLPLAGYPSGSAAMTGALAFTGAQTNAGNMITNIFRGSSGEATVNSAWLNWGWNGATYHTFGTTGWQLVSGTTGAGASTANIFRNTNGGVTVNTPAGGGGFVFSENGTIYGAMGSVGFQFYGTQTLAGASTAAIWRDVSGNLCANSAGGTSVALFTASTLCFGFNTGGMNFYGTQTLASNSNVAMYRDAGGNMISNVAAGTSIIDQVNGSIVGYVGTSGQQFPNAHTDPGNTAYGIWRESTAKQLVLQGPTDGVATLYGCGAGSNTGMAIKAHGVTNANRPASLSFRSEGKAFTNDGAWTNFYQLNEGTHYGSFVIFTNLGGSYYQFSIANTFLNQEYTGWQTIGGGPAGSLTAGASAVAFRVSGGWLQINVGTSISGAGYYHATFEGNVR